MITRGVFAVHHRVPTQSLADAGVRAGLLHIQTVVIGYWGDHLMARLKISAPWVLSGRG